MINKPQVRGLMPDHSTADKKKSASPLLKVSLICTTSEFLIHQFKLCTFFFILLTAKQSLCIFSESSIDGLSCETSTQEERCSSKGNSAVKLIFICRRLLRAFIDTFLNVPLSTLYSERLQIGSEISKLFPRRLNFLHYSEERGSFLCNGVYLGTGKLILVYLYPPAVLLKYIQSTLL